MMASVFLEWREAYPNGLGVRAAETFSAIRLPSIAVGRTL
jgi:hypothetical protein